MAKLFEIKIDRVELNDFFFKPRPKDLALATFVELNYNINVANKVGPNKSIIIQILRIDVTPKSNPTDILASIGVSIGYLAKNFSEAVIFQDGIYTVDSQLELRLRNISIGTIRGMLISKLQGTYLQAGVLPIVPDVLSQSK